MGGPQSCLLGSSSQRVTGTPSIHRGAITGARQTPQRPAACGAPPAPAGPPAHRQGQAWLLLRPGCLPQPWNAWLHRCRLPPGAQATQTRAQVHGTSGAEYSFNDCRLQGPMPRFWKERSRVFGCVRRQLGLPIAPPAAQHARHASVALRRSASFLPSPSFRTFSAAVPSARHADSIQLGDGAQSGMQPAPVGPCALSTVGQAWRRRHTAMVYSMPKDATFQLAAATANMLKGAYSAWTGADAVRCGAPALCSSGAPPLVAGHAT